MRRIEALTVAAVEEADVVHHAFHVATMPLISARGSRRGLPVAGGSWANRFG